MEVPLKCRGCERAQDIIDAPVLTFEERIFLRTGQQVRHIVERRHSYAPLVILEDGTELNTNVSGLEWARTQRAPIHKEQQLAELCGNCPGLTEAASGVDGVPVVAPVCGRLALGAESQQVL